MARLSVRVLMLAIIYAQFSAGIKPGLTYLEAKAFCTNKGGLPIPRSQKEQNEVLKKLDQSITRSVWLRGERRTLNKWTWVNGTEYRNIKPEQAGSCAGFDQNNKNIFTAPCTRKDLGHVCEARRCHDCYKDFGWKGQVCRKFGDKCFLFHCDNKNWFNARAACGNDTQDLAIIQNEMVKWMSELQFYCTRFWIGLRRETWRAEGQSLYANWGENEPSVGDCMMLKRQNGATFWASSDCSHKRDTICSLGEGSTTHGYSTPEARKAENGKSSNLTTIIVPVVICMLLVVFGIIVFVLWKRKKIFRRGERSNEEENCRHEVRKRSLEKERKNDENIPLLVLENQQYLSKASDRLTRVKISGGDEMNLEFITKVYKEVDIFHNGKKYTIDHLLKQIERTTEKRILISGDNGVGKTTVARRILKEWLNSLNSNDSVESYFRYVIFIPLSSISGNWKFPEIMENILKLPNEVAVKIYNDAIETPDKILIILDGYDEFKHISSKHSEITAIVEGKLHPDIKVLVTCRKPTRRYLGNGWDTFTENYAVSGFTEESVTKYIETYPSEIDSVIAKALKEEPLCSLARYPHLLRFLCHVLKMDIPIEETFENILEYYFKRYNQKYGSHNRAHHQQQDHNLLMELSHKEFSERVCEIGKMAADYILKGNVKHFPMRELNKISETSVQLGFLVGVDDSKICFPHDEIRQFFCAYFLAFSDEDIRQKYFGKMFPKTSLKDTLSNIVKFIAKLVSQDEEQMATLENDFAKFSEWKTKFMEFANSSNA